MVLATAGRGTMVSTSLLVRLSALLFLFCWTPSGARVIQKRAAFYIANDTMCIVDGDVYRNGDPVPTDDQCERCTCRPPGFSCVLRDCDTKPGCKAVRKAGECCPDYVCGCVHNNRVYEDGEVIKDLQNACYTCRCHGSSISCTFADCLFRGDCPPEYVPGECCPRYDHCPPMSSTTSTTTRRPIIQQEEIHFVNLTTAYVEKFTTPDTTVTVHSVVPVTTTTTAAPTTSEPWVTVKFTLSSEGKASSIKDFDLTTLSSVLPVQTATYTETTRFALPDEESGGLKTVVTTEEPLEDLENFGLEETDETGSTEKPQKVYVTQETVNLGETEETWSTGKPQVVYVTQETVGLGETGETGSTEKPQEVDVTRETVGLGKTGVTGSTEKPQVIYVTQETVGLGETGETGSTEKPQEVDVTQETVGLGETGETGSTEKPQEVDVTQESVGLGETGETGSTEKQQEVYVTQETVGLGETGETGSTEKPQEVDVTQETVGLGETEKTVSTEKPQEVYVTQETVNLGETGETGSTEKPQEVYVTQETVDLGETGETASTKKPQEVDFTQEDFKTVGLGVGVTTTSETTEHQQTDEQITTTPERLSSEADDVTHDAMSTSSTEESEESQTTVMGGSSEYDLIGVTKLQFETSPGEKLEESTTPGKVSEAETNEVLESETSKEPFYITDTSSTETHDGDLQHSTTVSTTEVVSDSHSTTESYTGVHEVTDSETSTGLSHSSESHSSFDLETNESSTDVPDKGYSPSTTDFYTEATETSSSHSITDLSSNTDEANFFSKSATTKSSISEEVSTESGTETSRVIGLQSTENALDKETTSISSEGGDSQSSTTEVQYTGEFSTEISAKRPDIAPAVFEIETHEETSTADNDDTSSYISTTFEETDIAHSQKPSTEEQGHTIIHSSGEFSTEQPTTTEFNIVKDLSSYESSGDSDSSSTSHISYSTPDISSSEETHSTTQPPRSSEPQDLNTDESDVEEVLLSRKKFTPFVEESSTSSDGLELIESKNLSTVSDSDSHSSLDAETESIEASGDHEIETYTSETKIYSSTQSSEEITTENESSSIAPDGKVTDIEESETSTDESADSESDLFSTITSLSSESESPKEIYSTSETSTQRPLVFSDFPSTSGSTEHAFEETEDDDFEEKNSISDVKASTTSEPSASDTSTSHSETDDTTTSGDISLAEDKTTHAHSEPEFKVTTEYPNLSANNSEEMENGENEDIFQIDNQNVSMSPIPGEGDFKPAADVFYPTDLIAVHFPHRPVYEDVSINSEIDEELQQNLTEYHLLGSKNASEELIPVENDNDKPLDSETISHFDFDSSTLSPLHASTDNDRHDETGSNDGDQSTIYKDPEHIDASITIPPEKEAEHSIEDLQSVTNGPILDTTSKPYITESPETVDGLSVNEGLDVKMDGGSPILSTMGVVLESQSTTEDYDASSVYDSKRNDQNSEITNTNKDGSPKPSTLDEIFSDSLENEDLAQNFTDDSSNNTYEIDPFISEKPVEDDDEKKENVSHGTPIATNESSVVYASSVPHVEYSEGTTQLPGESESTTHAIVFEIVSSDKNETHTEEEPDITNANSSNEFNTPNFENNEIDFSSESHELEHSLVNVDDNVLHVFGSENESGYVDNKSNAHVETDGAHNESDTFDLLNAESNSELANSHTHTTTEHHDTTTVSKNAGETEVSEESENVTDDDLTAGTPENIDISKQTTDSGDIKNSPELLSSNAELESETEAPEETYSAADNGESPKAVTYETDAITEESEAKTPHVETLVPESFNSQPNTIQTETSENVEVVTLVPGGFNTQSSLSATETSEGIQLETLVPESLMIHHDSLLIPTDAPALETLVPEDLKSHHENPFGGIADFGEENIESGSVPSELETTESASDETSFTTNITPDHDSEKDSADSDMSLELHHNSNAANEEDEESLIYDSEPETENGIELTGDSSSSTLYPTTFNDNSDDIIDLTPTEGKEPETSDGTQEETFSKKDSEVNFTTEQDHSFDISSEKTNTESVPTPVRVHVLFGQQDHNLPYDETPVKSVFTESAETQMEHQTTANAMETFEEHEGSAASHENEENLITSVNTEMLHSSSPENEEGTLDENLEYHEQDGEETTDEISTELENVEMTNAEDSTSLAFKNDTNTKPLGLEDASSINSHEASSEEHSTHDKYNVFGHLGNLFSESVSSVLPLENENSSETPKDEISIPNVPSESSNDLDSESNSLNQVNLETNETQKNFSVESYGFAYLGGGFLTGNSNYTPDNSLGSSAIDSSTLSHEESETITESENLAVKELTESDNNHSENSTPVPDHHLFFIPPNSNPNVEEAEKEEIELSAETPENEKGPEKGGEWFEPTLASSDSLKINEEINESNVEKDPTSLTNFEKGDGPEKGGELFEPTLPNLLPLGSIDKRNDSDSAITDMDDNTSTSEESIEESTAVFMEGEEEETNKEASGSIPIQEINDLHYQDNKTAQTDSGTKHQNHPESEPEVHGSNPESYNTEHHDNEPEHHEREPDHHAAVSEHESEAEYHESEPEHDNEPEHHSSDPQHSTEMAFEAKQIGTGSRPYQNSNPGIVNIIATYKKPNSEETTNQNGSNTITTTTTATINEATDATDSGAVSGESLEGDRANEQEIPSSTVESTSSESGEVVETTDTSTISNEASDVTSRSGLIDEIADSIDLEVKTTVHKNDKEILENLKQPISSEHSSSEATSHVYENIKLTEVSGEPLQERETTTAPKSSHQTTLNESHYQNYNKTSDESNNVNLLNSGNEVVHIEEILKNHDGDTTSTGTTQEVEANRDSLLSETGEAVSKQNDQKFINTVNPPNISISNSEDEELENNATQKMQSTDIDSVTLNSPSDLEKPDNINESIHEDENANIELEKSNSDESATKSIQPTEFPSTPEHTSTNSITSLEQIFSSESTPNEHIEISEPVAHNTGSSAQSKTSVDSYRYINNHNILQPYALIDVISDVFKAPGYDSEVHTQEQAHVTGNRQPYHKITKRHEPTVINLKQSYQIKDDEADTIRRGLHLQDANPPGLGTDPAFKTIRIGTSDGYHVRDTTSSRGRSYQESSVPSSARITSPLIIVGGRDSGKAIGNKHQFYGNGAIKAIPIPYYTSPPFKPFIATVSEDELFPGASSPTPA